MKKSFISAVIIAFAVLVLTNVPLLVPFIFKTDGFVFLGRRNINSQDVYTYVSFIEQSRQGAVLFKNLYTSEPQTPSLFRPSYLVIGKLAKITGASSILSYHVARIVLSIIFFVGLFRFLTNFFENEHKRLTAFALTIAASGVGFVVAQWLPTSIDLWVPEAIPFLTLFEAPHFVLSLTLMMLGFHYMMRFLHNKKVTALIVSFLMFLLLSLEHPFNLVVVVPTLFVLLLWNKQSFLSSLGISLLSGAGLVYQIVAAYQNPILRAWQIQNYLPSPAPISYIAGFGLILLFALAGIERFFTEQTREQKLVITWIGVTAFLLYAPVGFQRRFIEGIYIPLAILATSGIYMLFDRQETRTKNLLIIVTIMFLSLSNIFTVYNDVKEIQSDTRDNYYYRLSQPELLAIRWLADHTGPNDVILANRFFGNLIPGLTGRTVYVGHKIQTTDFDAKIAKIDEFLTESDETKARSFLETNGITYIYLGIGDSMVKYEFTPDTKPYVTKVYEDAGVRIYQVRS